MDKDFNKFATKGYDKVGDGHKFLANKTTYALSKFIILCEKFKAMGFKDYEKWFIHVIAVLVLNDCNNFDQAYSRLKEMIEVIKKIEGDYNEQT